MRVLITGGSGFIGSKVIDLAINEGHEVATFDVVMPKHGQFLAGDICAREEFYSAVYNFRPEAVIHLAARMQVTDSVEELIRVNIVGTQNVAGVCNELGVSRLLFASSAAVYGNIPERCGSRSPCVPTTVYGMTKFVGENIIRTMMQRSGGRGTILRLFNVFGDGMVNSMFAKWEASVKAGQPLRVFYGPEKAKMYRSFVSADFVAKAFVVLLDDESALSAGGDVVNICSYVSVSIEELAEMMAKRDTPPYSVAVIKEPIPANRTGEVVHSSGEPTYVRGLGASVDVRAWLSERLQKSEESNAKSIAG